MDSTTGKSKVSKVTKSLLTENAGKGTAAKYISSKQLLSSDLTRASKRKQLVRKLIFALPFHNPAQPIAIMQFKPCLSSAGNSISDGTLRLKDWTWEQRIEGLWNNIGSMDILLLNG